MRPVLIVYATREGQTRHIVEHIAQYLEFHAVPTAVYDLSTHSELYMSDYEAVILAASVHNRRHEPEAVAFATHYADDLDELPCLVLSVSSAQIIAESTRSAGWLRELAALGASKLLWQFLAETGLHTVRAHAVAGAIAYTKYPPLLRWAFRMIAFATCLPSDASRDHALTDTRKIEQYVDELIACLPWHDTPARLTADSQA